MIPAESGKNILSHNHNHDYQSMGNKLKYGLILSLIILILEVIGGLISNSLALLSDAGHVFTDIVALGLSWYGVRQAQRPPDKRMTFGYHRVGVIVAIVNAVTIVIIAAIILFEAYQRFQQPPEVKGVLMMSIAVVGLAANLLVTWWLRKDQRNNINIRSAFWHSMGDALASVGVIIGGVIILLTGQFWVDPLVSVLIGLIIVFAAWGILKEGLRVILEATPKDIDVFAMIEAIKKIPGVKDVHDVHVWSITSEIHAMAGHVLVEDISISKSTELRAIIEKVTREQFHIEHITLQVECENCDSGEVFCTLNGSNHDEEGKSLKS
jgi:cobalt-zinc-cadmium efflux system protein